MRANRLHGLLAAVGILTAMTLGGAQSLPAMPAGAALAAQDEEFQRLYQQISSSVVRVTVTQSAVAIVKAEGLGAEFEAWQKANERGRGRGGPGPGMGGPGGAGDGRSGAGGATMAGRSDGGPGGGFGRGGLPGGGGAAPGMGSGAFGAGRGGPNISSQVRNFLREEADKAQKTDPDKAARYRGMALRVQVNPTGFQGDMLAALLDKEGHALLLGGVFREAELPPAPPMKVVTSDGTTGEASFVGANLFAGFTVIKLSDLKGVTPTSWPASKLKLGQTLLPVTTGQNFVATVQVQPRFGEPFSEDRLPADEPSNLRFERYGAFFFDVQGRLAAVITTGGSWAGERFALSATRLQRDIAYIIKEGKDIEPRALGVAFVAPAGPTEPPAGAPPAVIADHEAAKKVWDETTKIIGSRRAVQVSAVTDKSLAFHAKLQKGDILLSIDGRPMSELVTADGNALPGLIQLQVDLVTRTGTVPLVIVRDGKQLTLQMPLQ